MITYQLILKDLAGHTLGEVDKFTNLKYNTVLNRPGAAQFSISVYDPKALLITTGATELYIYRDGILVWGGIIDTDTGELSRSSDVVTFTAKGFFEYMKKWRTDEDISFALQDVGNIIKSLVDTFQARQNGNYGIFIGAHTTGIQHERNHLEFKSVYDEIVQLSEVINGFDFEVLPTKEFKFYIPSKGSDKSSSVIFEYKRNFELLQWANDAGDMINRPIVQGSGQGTIKARSFAGEDQNLQQIFKLREDVVSYYDVEDQELLDNKGVQTVLEKGRPKKEFKIRAIPGRDPLPGAVETGDYIRIKANEGRVQLADVVRVKQVQVAFTRGIEDIDYQFLYT